MINNNDHQTLVSLDKKQCLKIAQIISKLCFKSSFYQRDFITFQVDKETKVRVYLYSLAICHQTHTLRNDKLQKAGWDYLEYIFIKLAKEKSQYLDPYFLAKQTIDSLAPDLGKIFSDTGKITDSTLDRRHERAKFLIDIAKVLVNKYQGRVLNLLLKSDGYLNNKSFGLYTLLEEMKAYSNDPVKKKAGGFIKFLVEANLYHVKDWKNYYPMMDYHMQRVLLRMGCVIINDKKLKSKIINREKINSDKEIRQSCVNATRLISKESGLEISKMNDIFYPLGRSFCTASTLCTDHIVDKLRMNFDKVIDLPNYLHCPFEDVCKASHNKNYLLLWQPIVETSNY